MTQELLEALCSKRVRRRLKLSLLLLLRPPLPSSLLSKREAGALFFEDRDSDRGTGRASAQRRAQGGPRVPEAGDVTAPVGGEGKRGRRRRRRSRRRRRRRFTPFRFPTPPPPPPHGNEAVARLAVEANIRGARAWDREAGGVRRGAECGGGGASGGAGKARRSRDGRSRGSTSSSSAVVFIFRIRRCRSRRGHASESSAHREQHGLYMLDVATVVACR